MDQIKIKKTKDSFLAAFLNIIFFVGYIYIGNFWRFALFNVVYFGVDVLNELMFGLDGNSRTLLMGIIKIGSMIDVYYLTKKYNQSLLK